MLGQMNENLSIDLEALGEEITRYLAAVELFRSLGCEPCWRPEPGRAGQADRATSSTNVSRVAH